MSHKDLLELLNNMDEVNDTVSSPHERVLLIDGLKSIFQELRNAQYC
jgi:hypothetical protein